jgi:putative ABC transport system ATP-binding protein
MAPLIRLEGVTKAFPMAGSAYTALSGIDLSVERGEFVAITGPSGHGKSTLMSILGGLDRPSDGRYYLDGIDVSGLSDDQMAAVRSRTIGFVFQSFNLVPTLTALENVELPMVYAHVSGAQRRERARALLEWAGLGAHARHRPLQLSGGQQQRVAICRALALDPPLLLADEPTGNLDSHAGQTIIDQLVELSRSDHTLVLVTHDPMVAAHARREVHIWDGRIEWDRPLEHRPGEPASPDMPVPPGAGDTGGDAHA